MIRVEKGAEVAPGIFEFRVPLIGFSGRSSAPLSDACRAIKRQNDGMGSCLVGIFRDGHDEPDMTCTLDAGAELTTTEPDHGRIRFRKYRSFSQRALEKAGK
jgi:hypothetical protein